MTRDPSLPGAPSAAQAQGAAAGTTSPGRPGTDRLDRSAAALRANLARRKAQQRARALPPADADPVTGVTPDREDTP